MKLASGWMAGVIFIALPATAERALLQFVPDHMLVRIWDATNTQTPWDDLAALRGVDN